MNQEDRSVTVNQQPLDQRLKPTKNSLESHEIYPKTCFDLIQKVGNYGKYQKNMFLIQLMILFITGTILMCSAFMFMNNQYVCESLGLLVQDCRISVCQIVDLGQKQKYFVKNKDKIQSLATDYGPFMCQDEFFLDMIMSFPYFGSLLGLIIATFTVDNFGRKFSMTVSLAVCALGTILLVTGFNLPMISLGIILSGAGINIASSMVYCFLSQTVQNEKRQKLTILVQPSYTIGAMVTTAAYALIGDWRIVSIILQAIPSVIILVIFVLYAQETPIFLLKGTNKRALKALNRIGLINFGLKQILTEEDIESVRRQQNSNEKSIKQSHQRKVSPMDLLRYASLRSRIIVCCMISFVMFIMYYGPSLIIDSVGFNTYVTSFAINLSELIGYIPVYFTIEKVKRRTTIFWLFVVTVISSFVLIFVKKPKQCDGCIQSVIQVVVMFVFRFAISTVYMLLIVYVVELFPTRVVGIAVSAVSCASTISSTLSSVIIGALERVQFNIMTFFFILGVIGCALTLLVPETLNKPIQEEIQELVSAHKNTDNNNEENSF